MWASGGMIREMEKAKRFIRMEIGMMESGKMIRKMGRGFLFVKMELTTPDSAV